MKIAFRRRHGAARIDRHELHRRARGLGRQHALEQDRVAPGEIGADQNQKIGRFQVFIGVRHRVRAEGPDMTGDRRGHAEAGIGVDIGRADEALHQLVGDVIVLGQDLAGDVEGDRVRPLAGDRLGKALRHMASAASQDTRSPRFPGGEAGGRGSAFRPAPTLGAKPAEIGGMLRVAGDGDRAVGLRACEHAAADAAIGAGGPRRLGRVEALGHLTTRCSRDICRSCGSRSGRPWDWAPSRPPWRSRSRS